MNEYDTEKLAKILESEYYRVDNPLDAELILINTCSVRDRPEQKLYSLLGELKEIKDERPSLMIGVGGCVAQQEGATILKRNKAVDFVFGTHNLSLVPSLIEKRHSLGKPQVAIDYRDEWEDLPLGFSGAGRASVPISISRGCNKNCSYCIVPTTRGREVSRSLAEIEKEVRISAHRGAKEIVLLGQTVNSWGLDLVPRLKFPYLLQKLSEIQGIERIRFVSPHPQEVRDDFIDLVVTNPKIARHIHLPLQSGSNRILKAMNRNYKKERYLDIVSALRSRVPDMGLTTDIIVGFPGETEEDFLETLELMKQVQFQNSYSYMFSPRPGTGAEAMEDDVPHEEKLRRLQILQVEQEKMSASILSKYIGREVEILIDGPIQGAPTKLHGRSSQNISVNLEDENLPFGAGDIIKATVTGAARFSLRASVVRINLNM